MAVAKVPGTSKYVEARAHRLLEAGYGRKMKSTGSYADDRGRAHHTWSVPSETRPDVEYRVDLESVGKHAVCDCPGFREHGRCEHAWLAELRSGGAGTVNAVEGLEQRVASLETKLEDLQEWLGEVADDLIARTT